MTITIGRPFADPVAVMVGGVGTGFLKFGADGLAPLVDATFSEAGSDVIASAAIVILPPRSSQVTMSITSTTFPTNSGSALGAVAYALEN
jgi:hypothetical protein